jgi:hypothetical protein
MIAGGGHVGVVSGGVGGHCSNGHTDIVCGVVVVLMVAVILVI